MSNTFVPVRIAVRDVENDQVVIEANDEKGGRRGILLPSEVRASFIEYFGNSNERLLKLWQKYETELGSGTCLLWDLSRLLKAISRAPSLPYWRKLASFQNANDGLHNATQALFMAEAHRRFPGLVSLDEVPKGQKNSDVVIASDIGQRRFEIKTVRRRFGLEKWVEGWRLKDVEGLVIRLRTKVEEGSRQIGIRGAVIVAVWADTVNTLMAPLLAADECSLDQALAADGTILMLSGFQSEERWFSFDANRWAERLDQLSTELSEIRPGQIRFDHGLSYVVSAAEANEWISIGPPIEIDTKVGAPADLPRTE